MSDEQMAGKSSCTFYRRVRRKCKETKTKHKSNNSFTADLETSTARRLDEQELDAATVTRGSSTQSGLASSGKAIEIVTVVQSEINLANNWLKTSSPTAFQGN